MTDIIHHFNLMLAAGGNPQTNWIFGAIFAVVWVIFGAINAASKKQEEKRREMVRQSLSTPTPTPPTTLTPPTARRDAASRAPVLAEQIRMRIPKQSLPTSHPRNAPPPQPRPCAGSVARPPALPRNASGQKAPAIKSASQPPRATTMVDARHQEISATEIRSVVPGQPRPASNGANADSIRRWMTPATLRQQFILTEVLQPPKALRPE